MKIVNLTTHDVNVRTARGVKTFAPSGLQCRVNIDRQRMKMIDGVEIITQYIGEVINFPNEPDTMYIVSGLVFESLEQAGYTNILKPNIKQGIKDNGIIHEVPNLIGVCNGKGNNEQ